MDALHPQMVDAVRQKADIVEVIADHVVLRKQGKNFVGLCPFHQDRKPSFNVSPSKQIYKCFACGEGGDVLRFVMQFDKATFSEAVLQLAQRFNVPIQARTPAQGQAYEQSRSRQEKLLEILYLATDFYQHVLRSTQGEAARQYLQQRGLSEATIQQFQVGFAPAGWQPVYEYLVNQKHVPVQLLADVGLVVERNHGQGWYDRFRHRIMLPIFDSRGRIIGFGGRSLGDEQPKYLNSPETELFDKSQVLYGLNFAREAIAKHDCALVVEGYFDVIALHQAGISTAVASMGTALTPNQVTYLLRYTESKQVVLNFDGDAAGLTAAERAIANLGDMARRGEVNLKILTLPAGKDADEFLKQNNEAAFQSLLSQAPLWLDWQIERLLADKELRNPVAFQQATQAMVGLLSPLTDSLLRSHYVHAVAERLSQGDARLALRLEDDLRRQVRSQRWQGKAKPNATKASKLHSSEAQLLQIYLHFPEYRQETREALAERDLQLSLSSHRLLFQYVLGLIAEQPELEQDGDGLLTALRNGCAHDTALNQQLSHLLWLDEHSRVALMRPRLVVRAAIANMELELCQKRYRYWTQLWDEAYSERNIELAQQYQQQIQAEHQHMQALQKAAQLSFAELTDAAIASSLQ